MGAFLNPSSPTLWRYLRGTTHPALEAVVPENVMKSAHGSLSRNWMRRASTTRTSFIFSLRTWALAPRYRSKENFTSSAVTASPLWKRAPLRSRNSYTSPSGETVQDSARHGALGPLGMGLRRAS